jgi:hypothetical protein
MRSPYWAVTRVGGASCQAAHARELWQNPQFTPSEFDMLIMIAYVYSVCLIDERLSLVGRALYDCTRRSDLSRYARRYWFSSVWCHSPARGTALPAWQV